MMGNSTAPGHTTRPLFPAERAAQDFIIAASRDPQEAIAKTFIGRMRHHVEESESARKRREQVSRPMKINFRTGTFVEDDETVLKELDWFKKQDPSKSHKRRFSLQSSSRLLTKIKNRDSKSKLFVETDANNHKKSIQRSTSDGKIVVNPENKLHLFDVYRALREKQGLDALPSTGKKQTGYIRKGLREKLEARANEARTKVQKQLELGESSAKDTQTTEEASGIGVSVGNRKRVKFAEDTATKQ